MELNIWEQYILQHNSLNKWNGILALIRKCVILYKIINVNWTGERLLYNVSLSSLNNYGDSLIFWQMSGWQKEFNLCNKEWQECNMKQDVDARPVWNKTRGVIRVGSAGGGRVWQNAKWLVTEAIIQWQPLNYAIKGLILWTMD